MIRVRVRVRVGFLDRFRVGFLVEIVRFRVRARVRFLDRFRDRTSFLLDYRAEPVFSLNKGDNLLSHNITQCIEKNQIGGKIGERNFGGEKNFRTFAKRLRK